jgi:ELWxxDGT repeat protein
MFGTSRIIRAIFVLWFALALAGCGGGGSATPPPVGVTNLSPSASAGVDQSVSSGATVTLNGSGSSDSDGTIASYVWTQTQGPTVTLAGANSSVASFTAPTVSATTTLVFQLTVSDNDGATSVDAVQVTISVTTDTGGTTGGITLLSNTAKSPTHLTVVSNKAFFVAYDNSPYPYSDQLWITDGTQSGTYMVIETDLAGDGYIGNMLPFNGKLIFTAKSKLWISDGTTAGTVMIKDISVMSFLRVVGQHLYFTAYDETHGTELWATDGTSAGTYMIGDLAPGTYKIDVRNAHTVTGFNGKLYFWAAKDSADSYLTAYPQLYAADAQQGSVVQLTDVTQESSILLGYDMVVYNNKLYFTWHDSNGANVELWSTDGTVAGTARFKDLNPGGSAWPTLFQIIGDKLIFFALDDINSYGAYKSLWVSDGTAAGTQVIHRYLTPEPNDYEDFVMMNGKYYFGGYEKGSTGVQNQGVWSTDGTSGGTQFVKGGITADSGPRYMAAIGGKLVFAGFNSLSGTEPWVTNGTESGTFMLMDVRPGTTGSLIDNGVNDYIVAHGTKAYLVAQLTTGDFQLLETDGTTAGTRVIAPSDATVTTNTMGGYGGLPVLVGNRLVFVAKFDGNYRLYGM